MNDNHRQGLATENEIDRHLVIENPNSCKQGFCPNHHENPHHEVITKYGFIYSHTTPIGSSPGYYAHHTYRFPNTDWCVSVSCRPGWAVSASKTGSGRHSAYFGNSVEKYVKRKSRELRLLCRKNLQQASEEGLELARISHGHQISHINPTTVD